MSEKNNASPQSGRDNASSAPKEKAKDAPPSKKEKREAKLAEALRANLRRRKQS